MSMNFYTHPQCHYCGKIHNKDKIHTFCLADNQPLEAKYKFPASWSKDNLKNRLANMWRYCEMLPVQKEENLVSLGEGYTPLLNLSKLESRFNQSELFVKDESGNPTGSFKARGMFQGILLKNY